jgi:predicted RNA-binding protein associated with RNAse of E/G family
VWSPGDQIVLREVWDGKLWAVRPVTVVRDDPELIALHLQIGTAWKRPKKPDGSIIRMPSEEWVLSDDIWRDKSVLHLIAPGAAHAVWAMWNRTKEFLGWYVNLQEPFRRSRVGFDYMDQMLDLVVSPDLSSWTWKDEEELDDEVGYGLMTREQAAEVRREGDRVLDLIRAKASPFGDGWDAWRPDPTWPIPGFPADWETVG